MPALRQKWVDNEKETIPTQLARSYTFFVLILRAVFFLFTVKNNNRHSELDVCEHLCYS